jgi:hypothetical protein
MKILGVTSVPAAERLEPPLGQGAALPVDGYSPSSAAPAPVLLPRPATFAERVASVQPPGTVPGAQEYRQATPARLDPEGDAQLIRLLDRVPEKLLLSLFRHLTKGEKWDQRGGAIRPPHRVGHEAPVDVKALTRDFEEMVRQTGIAPTVGPEHKWSPEARKYRRLGFWRRVGNWMRGGQDFPAPQLHFSKLFLMLAAGQTSRLAVTGQEAALESTLMGRPDRSVTPRDLLRQSYVLNGGDLYATLLTAENVLARDPFDPRRDEQPLQKKLQYLRHDTPEVGDNFAAWYHFFGIALYALVRPAWMAQGVALVESTGSVFLEGRDRQEALVNREGAEFGSWLRRFVKKQG